MEKFFENKLDILISHYSYMFGGGFSRTFMLAQELSKSGHNVTLLTTQKKQFCFPYQTKYVGNLKIVAFPDIVPLSFTEKGFGFFVPLLKTMYILFKKFDIIQSDSGHRPNAGIPCIIFRLTHKTKYISEWWDFFGKGGQYDQRPFISKMFLGSWDRLTEIPSKKISDGIIALSEYTKERAIQAKIPKAKVTIINGGCDFRNIKYYSNNDLLKSKYKIAPDTLTFGFIGMMKLEFYDIIPFIEAINRIKSSIKVKWFTTGLVLDPYIKEKYSIGDELIEFGWLDYDNYCEVIGLADIFILLLKENNQSKARWPNKIGDYFASGRLIMANPIGEIKSLMKTYPNSFLSVNWECRSIEESITEIIKNRSNILQQGYQNRVLAENEFSWHSKTIQLENFYKEILSQ